VIRQPRNNANGSFRTFSTRPTPEILGNPPWDPYPLLSKTLTVANLPPHYSPKNLYDLFCDFGKPDAAFMYSLPDTKGRRVGEVALATYLYAQKVHFARVYLILGS
jgi:hypothetical protein